VNKKELIDRITSINRAATREFLAEFSEHDLSDYVRHLDSLGLTPSDCDRRQRDSRRDG